MAMLSADEVSERILLTLNSYHKKGEAAIEQIAYYTPLYDHYWTKNRKSFDGGRELVVSLRNAHNSMIRTIDSRDDGKTVHAGRRAQSVEQAKYPWVSIFDYIEIPWRDLGEQSVGMDFVTGQPKGVSGGMMTKIVNMLKERHSEFEVSWRESFEKDYIWSSSSSDSGGKPPGLKEAVSLTPTTTIVGGVSRTVNSATTAPTYWRNQMVSDEGLTTVGQANLGAQIERLRKKCMRYKGRGWTFFAGSKMIEALRDQAKLDVPRRHNQEGESGAVTINFATNDPMIFGQKVHEVWGWSDLANDEDKLLIMVSDRMQEGFCMKELKANKFQAYRPPNNRGVFSYAFGRVGSYTAMVTKRNTSGIMKLT